MVNSLQQAWIRTVQHAIVGPALPSNDCLCIKHRILYITFDRSIDSCCCVFTLLFWSNIVFFALFLFVTRTLSLCVDVCVCVFCIFDIYLRLLYSIFFRHECVVFRIYFFWCWPFCLLGARDILMHGCSTVASKWRKRMDTSEKAIACKPKILCIVNNA